MQKREQSCAGVKNNDTNTARRFGMIPAMMRSGSSAGSRGVMVLLLLGAVFLAYRGIVWAAQLVTDTFTDTSRIASHENLVVDTAAGQVRLAGAAWTCGDAWTDTRTNTAYPTKQFGMQCWMTANMNIGTMTAGANNQGSSCTNIQKYCYSDTEANCATDGGLYQWNQAMCGSVTPGAQGICPAGWHIPTHDEWTTLERTVCESGTCATDFPFNTSTTGWRGTNEGTTLQDLSGFAGLLAGYRNTNGSFDNRGSIGVFWSSLQSGTNAWRRSLQSGNAAVRRYTNAKAYGFSVRCLKDS